MQPLKVKRRRSEGYSIVEAIVVLAIIGAMSAIAFPYFGGVMRRARMESEARQIDVVLLKSRLEAIRRGNNIGIEVSTDPSNATAYRSAVMYVDSNSDGSRGVSETILGIYPMTASSGKLNFLIDTYNNASPGTAAVTFNFTFTPFGSATAGSSAKAVFISDALNNVLQVGIPNPSSGKVAMTKKNSAGSYVGTPWTWN